MNRRKTEYTKPKLTLVELDNSISLVMMTGPIDNPDPRSGTKSSPSSDPFASPFDDKTFGG